MNGAQLLATCKPIARLYITCSSSNSDLMERLEDLGTSTIRDNSFGDEDANQGFIWKFSVGGGGGGGCTHTHTHTNIL